MSAHEKDCDRKGLCESARKRARGIQRERASERDCERDLLRARDTDERECERDSERNRERDFEKER